VHGKVFAPEVRAEGGAVVSEVEAVLHGLVVQVDVDKAGLSLVTVVDRH